MITKILVYVTIAFPILFYLEKISHKLNLLDTPNKRKIHLEKTSFIGGFAIAIILLSFVKMNNFNYLIDSLLIFTFVVSIIGLIDDKYHLNIGGKLSLQILASYLLIEKSNSFLINYIGNFWILGELYLGEFSLFFSLVAAIFFINACNYADGCDGNLTLQIVSIFGLILVITNFKMSEINTLILLIISILGVFLIFNLSLFKLPKIFLGDSGSMALGYFIAFFLIYISNQLKIHPIKIIWIITYLSHEFVATSLQRLIQNKSIFTAGLDHMHYFLKRKFSNTKSILLISIYNFLIGLLGFMIFEKFGQNISIITFITVFFLHYNFRIWLSNKYLN